MDGESSEEIYIIINQVLLLINNIEADASAPLLGLSRTNLFQLTPLFYGRF
jgi:hypothetical protein